MWACWASLPTIYMYLCVLISNKLLKRYQKCLYTLYPGVRIINQILDKVCLLWNFHPISLDFFRQLQRWIGGYWLELLTGHVSIGKEYWSVIGSRHVIVGNAGPRVCSRRVSPNVPRMTSDQSIPPIHLCSYLKKSNEIGWKFARKQTLSSIWFIILTLFYDWMIDNIHQHCILGFHGQGHGVLCWI